MLLKQADYSSDAFYHLMIQSIIPRPIAWVLSENSDGSYNVAPFSFFNGVSSEPPLLMISIGWKDETTRKDTWINIQERSHFVVHIPSVSQAEAMVATSKTLAAGESEVDFAKLATMRMPGYQLPRIAGPKIAMFCEKHTIIEMGTERIGMVIGEIKSIWVDDDAVQIKGQRVHIDSKKIDPLSRLGGLEYGALGQRLHIRRP